MSDLVKQLRSIDHMSVEDCFLQSYLYTKAADRIEELEAMLHLAYRAGVEATEIRACNWVNRDCFDMPEDTGLSLYIRAQPIPTSAELLAKFKEAT